MRWFEQFAARRTRRSASRNIRGDAHRCSFKGTAQTLFGQCNAAGSVAYDPGQFETQPEMQWYRYGFTVRQLARSKLLRLAMSNKRCGPRRVPESQLTKPKLSSLLRLLLPLPDITRGGSP